MVSAGNWEGGLGTGSVESSFCRETLGGVYTDSKLAGVSAGQDGIFFPLHETLSIRLGFWLKVCLWCSLVGSVILRKIVVLLFKIVECIWELCR